MEKIVSEIGESCYIGILREGNVIYLDLVEADHPVRIVSRVGKDVPAYCTSIGKVQLAFSGEDELNKIYLGARLKRYTDYTITSLPELKKHLKEVNANEYAIDNQEFEKNVCCIAVPIKDYLGIPVAAISVAGPCYRMSHDRLINDILPIEKKYAKEISKRLGYQN